MLLHNLPTLFMLLLDKTFVTQYIISSAHTLDVSQELVPTMSDIPVIAEGANGIDNPVEACSNTASGSTNSNHPSSDRESKNIQDLDNERSTSSLVSNSISKLLTTKQYDRSWGSVSRTVVDEGGPASPETSPRRGSMMERRSQSIGSQSRRQRVQPSTPPSTRSSSTGSRRNLNFSTKIPPLVGRLDNCGTRSPSKMLEMYPATPPSPLSPRSHRRQMSQLSEKSEESANFRFLFGLEESGDEDTFDKDSDTTDSNNTHTSSVSAPDSIFRDDVRLKRSSMSDCTASQIDSPPSARRQRSNSEPAISPTGSEMTEITEEEEPPDEEPENHALSVSRLVNPSTSIDKTKSMPRNFMFGAGIKLRPDPEDARDSNLAYALFKGKSPPQRKSTTSPSSQRSMSPLSRTVFTPCRGRLHRHSSGGSLLSEDDEDSEFELADVRKKIARQFSNSSISESEEIIEEGLDPVEVYTQSVRAVASGDLADLSLDPAGSAGLVPRLLTS